MSAVPATWMPQCTMKRIIVHWTAGTHDASENDRAHYHVLIEADGKLVRGIPPISGNAKRQVGERAHHTLNSNTESIGVSLCCMGNAIESPFDPGSWPMTREQWNALMPVLAGLCEVYEIAITNKTVLSHAEVQTNLGIKQRGKWDIARLAFDPSVKGAKACGDLMRKQVRAATSGVAPEAEEDGEPDTPVLPEPVEVAIAPTKTPVANGALVPQEGGVTAPPPNGDPDVFWVQMRLQQMNYSPGRIDWSWGGKTAGAITAFLNDVPDKIAFAAPLSPEDFKAVFPQLRLLIEKYLTLGFKRQIAVERATATAESIPGNKTVKQTWLARQWAKITTIFSGGTVGVGLLSEVVEPVKGPFEWAKANTPTILTRWWFWAGLAMIAGGAIWQATRKAEQATVDDYREGRLN